MDYANNDILGKAVEKSLNSILASEFYLKMRVRFKIVQKSYYLHRLIW